MADQSEFRVVFFPNVRDQLTFFSRIAARMNLASWLVSALRTIDRKLHENPWTWGDPLFEFPAAELSVYQGCHENFVVTYAVHSKQPVVFVRQIQILAGSPLFGHSM